MAKHISIGQPVNDSERWAFALLADQLPDDYVLLTNFEVLNSSGQALEVDALVLGEWGLYVVDVKGYVGRLSAGVNSWQLAGRSVDNALAKANLVGKILAGKIRERAPRGVFAPWCQGMVFVTGREGADIELHKSESGLSVFTACDIIEALSSQWGQTAPQKHRVVEAQKTLALDVIGRIGQIEQRSNRVQDFCKEQCLLASGGLEIWRASYSQGDWNSDWLLKILLPSQCRDDGELNALRDKLQGEFVLMQRLSGCSGVPYAAPLIDDGEQLVLPVRMPRGVPLSDFVSSQCDGELALEILRRSATSLQQIHRRGIAVGNWRGSDVFVSDDGDVEFIDIDNSLDSYRDIQAYGKSFQSIAHSLREPRIKQWFDKAAAGYGVGLDALRSMLSAAIAGETLMPVVTELALEIVAGAVIDGRYRLADCLRRGHNSELWRARHILGQFDCGLSIYHSAPQRWPQLNSLYRSMVNLYHPAIERVISFGQLPASDNYFISRAWLPGQPLEQYRTVFEPALLQRWFAQLLAALQYLHRLELFHGGICPLNIICSESQAVLVDFGVGLDLAAIDYSQQYADPQLWLAEGAAERDLYALVASFVDVMSSRGGSGYLSHQGLIKALDELAQGDVAAAMIASCRRVLHFQQPLDAECDYLELFGLAD